MLLSAPIVALMLPAAGAFGPIAPGVGLGLVVISMFLFGLANGPLDIALFTIRQRRTDPAWMGRAFAVSMAFNFMGYPFGAIIAGALATDSLPAALVLGVIACLVAGRPGVPADPDVGAASRPGRTRHRSRSRGLGAGPARPSGSATGPGPPLRPRRG